MENKPVYFKAKKGKNLIMVLVPMGLKDPQGNKITSKRVYFGLDPLLGPAVAKVTDPEIVKMIRKSELYKSGWITEIDVKEEDLNPQPTEEKVKSGLHSSKDVKVK